MKNAITHIKAQRARRPREQHLKIDTRKVDEVTKGVDELYAKVFLLETTPADRDREIANLRGQIEALKSKE